MSSTPDELVDRARQRIDRLGPEELSGAVRGDGLVVDIRPAGQRRDDGDLPGAVVVERNVLEWRLQPGGEFSLPSVTGYEQRIVIVCTEGYASSLAAATLADMGFDHPADLIGGYRAWRRWTDAEVRAASGAGAPDPAATDAAG